MSKDKPKYPDDYKTWRANHTNDATIDWLIRQLLTKDEKATLCGNTLISSWPKHTGTWVYVCEVRRVKFYPKKVLREMRGEDAGN